jgi:uncharacterized protein YgiM (DUF1202 family)
MRKFCWLLALTIGFTLTVNSFGANIISASAQSRRCYEVQDPDGWANVRDRDSNEIVAQVDNGQRVLVLGTVGESVVLASPHNQFLIHRSRVKLANSRAGCFQFTAIESDGYLNLRESPNGKILGRIQNGTALMIVGNVEENWVRILTPDGRSGVVSSRSFEIYN